MTETNNTLTIKVDKGTTLPLIDGVDKSAYAIAVSHGFKGTEQEWLDSLRGPQGREGVPGPPGPPGTGADIDLSAYPTKQEAENLYLKKVDIRNYLAMLGDPKYILRTELNSLKGERGPIGPPGPKGEPFKYSDFTQEQLNALKGPKGDKGEPLRFEDLTESQKQQLKGPKGDSISGASAVRSYDVIWGIARAGERGNGRGYLEYSPLSGFGKLHLDIVLTQNSGNGGVIATLPANAPVPSRLLEVAIDTNNNSVYIEPNSRNIKAWGVAANKRYIFDIVGFWKES